MHFNSTPYLGPLCWGNEVTRFREASRNQKFMVEDALADLAILCRELVGSVAGSPTAILSRHPLAVACVDKHTSRELTGNPATLVDGDGGVMLHWVTRGNSE